MHPLSAAFLADKPAPNKELRSRFPLVVGSEIFSELACRKQSQPRRQGQLTLGVTTELWPWRGFGRLRAAEFSSSGPGNKPGHTGLHHCVESDAGGDALPNFPHRVFR
jgi:hypothetical protein